MKMRPVLGLAAALCALIPAIAQADDSAALRKNILQGCTLQAWQFAVRIEQGGVVVPQMSPTLPAEQKTCIRKLIEDYRRNGLS